MVEQPETASVVGVLRQINQLLETIQKKLALIGTTGDFDASLVQIVATLSNGLGVAAALKSAIMIIGLLGFALLAEAWPRSKVRRLRLRLHGGDRDGWTWSGPALISAAALDALAAGLFAPIYALLYASLVPDEPAMRLMAIAAGLAVLLGRGCLICANWLFPNRPNGARGLMMTIAFTIAYGWLAATFLETAGILEGPHTVFCLLVSLMVFGELLGLIWRTRAWAEARLAGFGDMLSLSLASPWVNLATIMVGVFWCVWVICFLTVGERTLAAIVSLAGVAALLLSGWRDWRGGFAAMIGTAGLGVLWSRDAEDLLLTPTAFTLAATLLGGAMAWRAIDVAFRRLGPALRESGGDEEETEPSSRLETVAPLVRVVLLSAITLLTVMISLSTLGVDTGPLLAGAGVIGLAIGFGAQTLIRDIITGVFFLAEDAFRIGEYVDVGANKRGEVEAISPRSIRLRHHRGAIHRVPFSEIRTLTNHSRDWAVDKILLQVDYQTDVETLRKLVKSIGQDLSADPEFGPSLLGPLKSQGITAFGESGLQIRLKFTARPKDLFLVRREAMKRLHVALTEAGIKFAPARRAIAIDNGSPPVPVAVE